MPIPMPRKRENKEKFMDRCLSALKDEFKDIAQRYAVCIQRWEDYGEGRTKSGEGS